MIRASGADDDVAPYSRLLFRKLRFLVIVDSEGDGRHGIIRYREGYTTGNHRFRMRGGGKTQAIGVCRSGDWDEGFSALSCSVEGAPAWSDWRSPDHPAVEARVVAQASIRG